MPSQYGAKPTLVNTGLSTALRASESIQARQEQSHARQAARQHEREFKAAPTQVSPADKTIAVEEVNQLPKNKGVDYLIRDNGTIHIRSTQNKFDRFYLESSAINRTDIKQIIRQYKLVGSFSKNEHGYIALPTLFETNTFAFRYTGSPNENYIAGQALAALLGALKRAGIHDVSFNHWSNADGSSPAPSRSHKSGTVGDIRPLRLDQSGKAVLTTDNQFDAARNARLIEAFRKFGWTSILSEKNPATNYLTPGTTNYSGYSDARKVWHAVRHNNHYHIQHFKPHLIYK